MKPDQRFALGLIITGLGLFLFACSIRIASLSLTPSELLETVTSLEKGSKNISGFVSKGRIVKIEREEITGIRIIAVAKTNPIRIEIYHETGTPIITAILESENSMVIDFTTRTVHKGRMSCEILRYAMGTCVDFGDLFSIFLGLPYIPEVKLEEVNVKNAQVTLIDLQSNNEKTISFGLDGKTPKSISNRSNKLEIHFDHFLGDKERTSKLVQLKAGLLKRPINIEIQMIDRNVLIPPELFTEPVPHGFTIKTYHG